MADFDAYDVIVVGGGHAGAEAAHAAGRMGARTLLITMSIEALGRMSCNPAIGGIGKGQIVREIDALGGLMGRVTDRTGIQFRMLNRSKGPAVWSPRAQSDRTAYSLAIREELEAVPELYFRQDMVTDVLVDNGHVTGVRTQIGQVFRARSVILTSGTFLNGTIHIGERQHGGGRAGERAATGISASLERLGFEVGRLKTGTPPRVDGRTVDFARLSEQKGDEEPVPFSFMTDRLPAEQRSCWLTYTNPQAHDILRGGFEQSPMFAGRIQGQGPRYCPSIEDKIDRFSDKDQHQLFLEPEGLNTYEIYVNGFSTSLPEEVQFAALRQVAGMERVHMLRPGYAIEYDYFPPHQLRYSLETKLVEGLFFAGQINGTTGYEEAAAQGLLAGINAVQTQKGAAPLVLQRSQAYIGVLVDDLVAKGTDEPYRMFTSRAEHRLLLRQDNADQRLTPLGYELGLASSARMKRLERKQQALATALENLQSVAVAPEEVNGYLDFVGTTSISEPVRIARLVTRPQVQLDALLSATGQEALVPPTEGADSLLQTVETTLKYAGYLDRELEMVDRMSRMESLRLPPDAAYSAIDSITIEAREKLERIRPDTIGQASRISGVSPADVSALLILLKSDRLPSDPNVVSRETPPSPN